MGVGSQGSSSLPTGGSTFDPARDSSGLADTKSPATPPRGGDRAGSAGERRGRAVAPSGGTDATGSPIVRYALLRLALIPAQVLFVLWLLYLVVGVPAYLHPATGPAPATFTLEQFFAGFGTSVVNIFTGNWGVATGTEFAFLPWSQVYAEFLPNSIQVALFALPLSALLAYLLSFPLGWSRRPAADVPARMGTLGVTLVPVLILGLTIEFGLFFAFFAAFHDIPGNGIIPSPTWFDMTYGGFPSWIVNGWSTRPTGLPLIDGIVHHAWTFELITLTKVLMQGLAVALIYVTVFLRHARSIVASASREAHVDAGRARGLSESTLRSHARREVLPSFLLLFALTIPAYLATQFAVEAVFNDPGVGYLTMTIVATGQTSGFFAVEAVVFVLAFFILVAIYLLDLLAVQLDPRGALTR